MKEAWVVRLARDRAHIKEENAFLKKPRRTVSESVEVKYALIRRHEGEHAIALMCGLLSVSRSGYYEWRGRPTRPRTKADESLVEAIRRITNDHTGRAGSPRITWALHHEGWRVGKNRVARLMRQNALRAKAARTFAAATHSDHNLPVAPNLLNQDFSAQRPNQKWVSDITYIATDEGWLYLAVVLDLYARTVGGLVMSERMTAKLACDALRMALWRRKRPRGVILHSDPWQPILRA